MWRVNWFSLQHFSIYLVRISLIKLVNLIRIMRFSSFSIYSEYLPISFIPCDLFEPFAMKRLSKIGHETTEIATHQTHHLPIDAILFRERKKKGGG